MSNSRYNMLCKIRTLSASVAILTYLFLQSCRSTPEIKIIDLYDKQYNIVDTSKHDTTPIEYNPRGGQVFLAKNR